MVVQSYRVVDAGLSLDEVLRQSNSDCYHAAVPGQINSLSYFERLLMAIYQMPRLEHRLLRNFMLPVKDGRIAIFLRHDVDHDIITASAMSRLEARYGLRGTYFLLHSHPFVTPGYYARYDEKNGILLRNACLAPIYRRIQADGNDVGLHVDAVGLYLQGLDGQHAVVEELAWLRAQGLHVDGMAAHGSFPSYCVENYEFFSEYHLGHYTHVVFEGTQIRLGGLSARELGLVYEANYVTAPVDIDLKVIDQCRQQGQSQDKEEFLRWYLHDNPYCRWGADYTFWLYEENCWAISGHGGKSFFMPRAGIKDVIDFLRDVPAPARIVLHIHPFYVGLRRSEYTFPE